MNSLTFVNIPFSLPHVLVGVPTNHLHLHFRMQKLKLSFNLINPKYYQINTICWQKRPLWSPVSVCHYCEKIRHILSDKNLTIFSRFGALPGQTVCASTMDLTADLASLMAKQQQQFPANNNRQNNYKAAADCPGYVTEKLYMLLQLYLQNKGWNSSELLQCFAELKDSSPVLPNAAYLQWVLVNYFGLDSRLNERF